MARKVQVAHGLVDLLSHTIEQCLSLIEADNVAALDRAVRATFNAERLRQDVRVK